MKTETKYKILQVVERLLGIERSNPVILRERIRIPGVDLVRLRSWEVDRRANRILANSLMGAVRKHMTVEVAKNIKNGNLEVNAELVILSTKHD